MEGAMIDNEILECAKSSQDLVFAMPKFHDSLDVDKFRVMAGRWMKYFAYTHIELSKGIRVRSKLLDSWVSE
ncbi:unnamed protein product, partial [Oikopleura dioica]